jgi:DNA-binding MarR family transcriptional regulator
MASEESRGRNGQEKRLELTDNTLWLLKQAFYFSLTTVNEAVKQHGVSTAQIGLLRQLTNEPGLSGAELARRLLITPQGVQIALTALEKRGLVQRRQDPQHGRILQAVRRPDSRRARDTARSPGPSGRKGDRARGHQRPRRSLGRVSGRCPFWPVCPAQQLYQVIDIPYVNYLIRMPSS